MTTDWFDDLTAFAERSYAETQAKLEKFGQTLRSKVNNRSYVIGELETPPLADLRRRAACLMGQRVGTLRVTNVVGDVASLHRDPAHRHAMFQVASQFNLLEMTGPDVSPEDGVTRYVHDRTQGPACAMAAGAATIYRNYCVPVDGQAGQTRHRQLDCLKGLDAALGNEHDALWTMRNGYALCTERGLAGIHGGSGVTPGGIRAVRPAVHLHQRLQDPGGPAAAGGRRAAQQQDRAPQGDSRYQHGAG